MSKPYNILTDFKGSGNNAIDSLALCIMWHRKRGIGLKAIHVKQPYYDQIKTFTEKQLGRKLEDGEFISFDHVNIDMGSVFQMKPIMPETYADFTNNSKGLIRV